MSEIIDIPEVFRLIVAEVSQRVSTGCYFDYGAHDVVKRNLIRKDNSFSMKDAKFPLVWLVTPIRQVKAVGRDYASELPEVDILILVRTDPNYTVDLQESMSYEGVLRPIYRELLKAIDDSYSFTVLSRNAIPHEVKEWPYHSGDESVTGRKNLFDDYIDCIQIRRLSLQVNHTKTFINS